jgi:hypothetical protein
MRAKPHRSQAIGHYQKDVAAAVKMTDDKLSSLKKRLDLGHRMRVWCLALFVSQYKTTFICMVHSAVTTSKIDTNELYPD